MGADPRREAYAARPQSRDDVLDGDVQETAVIFKCRGEV